MTTKKEKWTQIIILGLAVIGVANALILQLFKNPEPVPPNVIQTDPTKIDLRPK